MALNSSNPQRIIQQNQQGPILLHNCHWVDKSTYVICNANIEAPDGSDTKVSFLQHPVSHSNQQVTHRSSQARKRPCFSPPPPAVFGSLYIMQIQIVSAGQNAIKSDTTVKSSIISQLFFPAKKKRSQSFIFKIIYSECCRSIHRMYTCLSPSHFTFSFSESSSQILDQ